MSSYQSWDRNEWHGPRAPGASRWDYQSSKAKDWQNKPSDRANWDSSKGTWGSSTWSKSGSSWQQDSVSKAKHKSRVDDKQEVHVNFLFLAPSSE